MRRILVIMILPVILAATFAGCNNKPPFAKLMLAVDSVNAYYQAQPEMTAPDAKLVYDQVTNTVKFCYELPSAKVAEFQQDNIGVTEDFMLNDVLPEAPYDLFEEIVDAEANVMIVYDWGKDKHSEYLIQSDRLKAAYNRYKEIQKEEASQGPAI